jgi:O-antigen ligase
MKQRSGFLHWVFPAMLGLVALTALLSGRDLSQTFNELAIGGGAAHPLVPWAQRVVSIILLAAAGERIISHVALHKHMPSPILTIAFIAYWFTTVATSALFGSHRQISHEYLYPLIFGFAGLLATPSERDRIVDASRTALFWFLLAGVLLIPVLPSMVLDASYKQGLIPGLPRFGGLAPHPVALGMFALVALLCLWARPFQRRWLNRAAWILGLGVLFIAQSKTAWIAFVLCAISMFAVRQGPAMWRRLGDPREGGFGIVVCLAAILLAIGLLALVPFGEDLSAEVADFSESAQGAQLISMTGRDQIWAIAREEWHENPVFGYGPSLWDDAFRRSISMPNATSAHNQFLDTLARSGTVGAVGLVIYALVLLVMSVRYARATGGLSLALFVSLALLSISEVPLLLLGYGTELMGQLLLVTTLASAAASRVPAPRTQQRPAYRTVT